MGAGTAGIRVLMLAATVAAAVFVSQALAATSTTVVVTPASTDWAIVEETVDASGAFVVGPGTAPGGTGSVTLTTDATGGVLLAGAVHRGVGVSQITSLGLRAYVTSGVGLAEVAPSVQIGWDPDLTDSDDGWKGRLVGIYTGTVSPDAWVSYNALTQYDWFFSQPVLGDPSASGCTLATPCSWATVVATYPSGGISDGFFAPPFDSIPIGFLGLKAGGGEGVTERSVDLLSITIGTDTTTYDFEPAGTCLTSTAGSTITLLADCTTDETILVPNGFTLDGDGYTITGIDPPAGGHFLGAVVQGGPGAGPVTVENLEVTTSGLADVCDAGVDRLRGILFDGVGGTIRNNAVTHIQQGSGSGCQEGNAIEVRNAPFDTTGPDKVVVIEGNAADDFIKNGITANGSVAATITGNTVIGNGPVGVPLAAQNGIQIGFGATATIRSNTVRDHNYTPASFVACGLLYFEADGVRASKNTFSGNERDVCNFGRGGGQYNPAP